MIGIIALLVLTVMTICGIVNLLIQISKIK